MNRGYLGAISKAPLRRYFKKRTVFEGEPKDICEQIIEKLWNGVYYQTGLGHFNYFWIRDFGIVVESLIHIGERERVEATLKWALAQYMRSGRVALSIDSRGRTFNAPNESIDALPWLIYSLYVSEYQLSGVERAFLEEEISRFEARFIEPKSGAIKRVKYSELRDATNYRQSSYAVLMVYLLAEYSRKMKFRSFTTSPSVYLNLLETKYWNGRYFRSDLNNDTFSAECNLFPFILGVFRQPERLASIFQVIKEKEIAQPFPMKYTDRAKGFRYHWWGRMIMPNYAGSTVWTWMGALYLQLLKAHQSDDYEHHFESFSEIIRKYHNFPELLKPSGDWYKTILYKAEEGMIWSALYLKLVREEVKA